MTASAPVGPDPEPGPVARPLRVLTRCDSLADFVRAFSGFADASSIFVVSSRPRSVGLRSPLLVQLKGGETVMSGEAEVTERHTEGTGPKGRNGMRLRLLALDAPSRAVHERLLARGHAREEGAPTWRPPPPAPAPAGPPAPEQRAPSSTVTLPANPLSELSPEALESFVECTLHEERGSELTGREDRQPLSAAAASLRPVLAAGSLPPAGPRPAPSLVIRHRRALVAVACGASLGALVLAGATASRRAPPPVAAARPLGVPRPGPATAGAGAIPRPPVGAEGAAQPAQRSDPPPPTALACLTNIRSSPTGARVIWAGREIGSTPLADAPVPCGAAAVRFELEKHVPAERAVLARLGSPVPIVVKLARPLGRLEISSVPEGVRVTVGGRRAGVAPVSVDVPAYGEIAVVATAPGFKPWSKRVLIDPPVFALPIVLEPLAGRR